MHSDQQNVNSQYSCIRNEVLHVFVSFALHFLTYLPERTRFATKCVTESAASESLSDG